METCEAIKVKTFLRLKTYSFRGSENILGNHFSLCVEVLVSQRGLFFFIQVHVLLEKEKEDEFCLNFKQVLAIFFPKTFTMRRYRTKDPFSCHYLFHFNSDSHFSAEQMLFINQKGIFNSI